jgi:hypothetical protein
MTSTKITSRTFVSPLAAMAFIAVGGTGILMLLHIESSGLKLMHEWIGLLFAAAGVVHLVLNWRVLLSYLSKKTGIAAVLATLLIATLLFVFAPEKRGPGGPGQRGGPPRMQQGAPQGQFPQERGD